MKDNVKHPNHYENNGYETIDIIEDVVNRMQETGNYTPSQIVSIANVVKYVTRFPDKNGQEDLEKALNYLCRATTGEWFKFDNKGVEMERNKTMVMHINKNGNVLEEATNFKKYLKHLNGKYANITFQTAILFTYIQLIELCYLIEQKEITDEKGMKKLMSLATTLDLLLKEIQNDFKK